MEKVVVCLVTQPQESVNGETFTSFYDTEYMWVGNLNANDDGSQSNFNVEVNGERLEINEQRDVDGNVVNSRSFRFDVETGDMLGGTEISGVRLLNMAPITQNCQSLSKL